MITYPNFRNYSDNELREFYFYNTRKNEYFHKLGWHWKASGHYDLAIMATSEMTRRSKAKVKGDE